MLGSLRGIDGFNTRWAIRRPGGNDATATDLIQAMWDGRDSHISELSDGRIHDTGIPRCFWPRNIHEHAKTTSQLPAPHCDKVDQDSWDADDLVQQTLLKALAHLEQFRFEANFTSWLTSIARNELRSLRRKPIASVTTSDGHARVGRSRGCEPGRFPGNSLRAAGGRDLRKSLRRGCSLDPK